MLCYRCGGTKQYLGNGMVTADCFICDKYGNLIDEDEIKSSAAVKIDKRSKAYLDAIKDIMALYPEMSKEDAAKMFDETYSKNE